ncbi:hypothetical protein G5714_002499 [Onychostoma macrolepis]|uniref:Uncharacterized protein n=1 Tax=Onychostoma macrolepis TaxID=369639 RepID=A0A7J6DF41_9TELE|nr:hypothetical protein G5714_002499 [Onychostoma macrolepis]
MLHPLMFVIVVFNTGMTIVEWTFLMHEIMRDMDSLVSSSGSEERLWRAVAPQRLLRSQASDATPFLEYRPPARDSFSVPPHVLYVAVGLLLVVVATYAIVGHLIDDLLHDLADWVFGLKTEAGDAERGREEDRVRLDEERAGLLPGFTEPHQHTASGLHYITSL